MVAAMPFIRDDSMDQRFVDHWNQATKAQRAKLLKDAGRDPHLKQRAWGFVPQSVRIDVVCIMKRITAIESVGHAATKPANDKHFWWQDSEKETENV